MITITKAQLQSALHAWETDRRLGRTRTAEETAALPVEQVASESAAHLWGLLDTQPAGDFRDRVRAEAAELDGRIEKLAAFTVSDKWAAVDPAERLRLVEQLEAMRDYSRMLATRIDAFTV